MGIGREVADAYIDVHGDLKNFRRDLEGANADVREAALEQADLFTDAWAKRVQQDVNGQWASIIDAMYSDKQIDWDRMFGQFDGRNLEQNVTEVKSFLSELNNTIKEFKDEEGNVIDVRLVLDDDEFDKMNARIDEVVKGMNKASAASERFEQEQRGLGMAIDQNRKFMAAAAAENERWARTFEGISKNDAIKNLNEDFEKLSKAMSHSDIGKWGNRLEGDFQRMAQRVREVSAAMMEQRRISDDDAAAMVARVDAFIQAENDKSKAMRDSLAETQRLKDAQDRYNQSLAGMARNFHFSDLEAKFKQLAVAIDSNDWSGMARGAQSMDELRQRVNETATEMHRLGRMSDQELTMVRDRISNVNIQFQHARDNSTGFGTSMRNALTRTTNLFTRLNNATRGFREHLQSLAGLNVFGDLIRKGLDFVHNMDRIAVSAGKNTLALGTMAGLGGAALAGMITVASDLADVLGGLAVAAPAFLVGTGIGIGVLSAALKDMDTVLKDLKPSFEKLQDTISAAFWKQAEKPIRNAVKALLPLISEKTADTASALGDLVGDLANAFANIPADKIARMFDRMNRAIRILGGAMAPIIRAFTTLGDVGSKYFERFATWIVTISEQFDAFVQNAAANGDLDRWIERAIQGMKDIYRAVEGAVGIFDALNRAAERAGFGGLKTFADALQNASDIMNSPAFQDTLVIYLDGVRDLAIKVGDALKGLGPAAQSFAPVANAALGTIGDTVATLIGYIGDIFTNEKFQQGVKDFTEGLRLAVEKLQPAIKPFADSLGTAMTLLGQIVVAVAEIATAFMVHLSPVLDSMSTKFGTLIQPLKDTAINFIKEMEGPLRALDEKFVGPLVTAFKEDLLPAINDFIKEFGPFAEKVITDLGPAFKILVEDVLPNLVRLAGELLDPLGKIIELLSPTLALTLEKIGNAFKNVADGIKVLKGELPITELQIFKAMDPKVIQAQAEAMRAEVARNMDPKNAGSVGWDRIIADIFLGAPPHLFWSRVWNMIGPTDEGVANFQKDVENIRTKIVNDWNAVWSGELDRQFADKLIEWFPGQADFINGVTGWIDDVFTGKWFGEAKTNIETMWNDTWKEGGNADQLEDVVNGWLNTNVFEPFGRAMDNIGKVIPESFKADVEEWGLGPAVVNWFNNDIMPEINKGFTEAWKNVAEGRWGSSPEGAAKWEGFWKGWNEFWSAPEGSFTDGINDSVNKWFEDYVFKPVRDAWDGMWKNVTDFLNGDGGEGGGRDDNNGQAAWSGFWSSFWGGFEGMWNDAKTGNADISATVNKWLDDNVWKPIGKWVEELDWGQIAEDLFNGFISGLTGKSPADWEKHFGAFTSWVEDIKRFFGIQSPSTLMFDLAKNVVDGFLNGFGDFGASVAAKWEELKTTLATKFEEIKTALNTWIEERKADWNNFWGGFGTTIATKWEEFKTTLATKFEEVKTGLNKWIEDRKTDWNNFWGSFGTTISTKWEEFKKTINTKIEEIKTGLNTWIEDRKRDWNNFWGSFGETIRVKWEEFKNTIRTKIEEIKTNINRWIEDRKRDWNNFWGGLGTTLRTKWEEFRLGIARKIEEIKTNIRVFGETVRKKWEEFWGGVGTFLKTKWDEFKKTAETKGQEIIDWFKSLPEKIKTAMGDLWTNFTKVGADIADGLRRGIEDGWNWVTTAAKDLADGAVKAAQEALDEHSPSRVFMEIGWNVGRGLVIGLDRMGPDVAKAGEGLVQGLQQGVESRMDPLLNTLQTITAAVTDTVTADLSKSVMYSTGRDAAQGLADGLKANRSAVHTALGSLGSFSMPSQQITVGGAFAGPVVGRPTADVMPGRSVTIAEGAIKIETPTKSPELVAAKVLDGFANLSNL